MKVDISRQPLGAATGVFLLLLVFFSFVPGIPWQAAAGGDAAFPLPGAWLDGTVPQPWNRILAAVIVLTAGMALTLTATRYMLYGTRTYLPMLGFLAICCAPAAGIPTLAGACCALLLTYALRKGVESFKRRYCFDALFRAGLALGTLPLLYAPAVVLVAVLPAALVIYKRSAREAVAAAAGLLLPLGAGSYLCWAVADSGGLLWNALRQALTAPGMAVCNIWNVIAGQDTIAGTIPVAAAASMTTALLILGTVSLLLLYPRMRTRTRKIHQHLLFLLAVCLPVMLLPGSGNEALALLAVPGGLVIPAFFVRSKGTVPSAVAILWLSALLTASLFRIIHSLQ